MTTRPCLRLWDLRKDTTRPMFELTAAQGRDGHSRGIVDLAWCPHDEAIIASTGKDNRTLFWDLYTCAVVDELDPSEIGGNNGASDSAGAGSGAGVGGSAQNGGDLALRVPAGLVQLLVGLAQVLELYLVRAQRSVLGQGPDHRALRITVRVRRSGIRTCPASWHAQPWVARFRFMGLLRLQATHAEHLNGCSARAAHPLGLVESLPFAQKRHKTI